jgi:parallel beta-helix repeat protein
LSMKRISVAFILMSLLLVPIVGSALVASEHSLLRSIKVSPIQTIALAQYQMSEPFVIEDNADFALLGATGDGTSTNPYIFSNLQISNTSSCIQVTDTTAYFVISDCKFETEDSFPVIWFNNVENGRVEYCEISGLASGLEIWDSLDCSIVDSLFTGCWDAVILRRSSSSIVINNVMHNNRNGILFDQSDYCEILNNSIYANSERGIQVDAFSHNNTVYGNSIGWNYQNAFDVGANNTFDDGLDLGNFWSDFNGTEPYQIPGAGGSIDAYAQLLEDLLSPVILPIEDIVIDVDTRGNILTWTAYDLFPRTYEIEENLALMASGIWSSNEISYGLDHLDVGTYSITLRVLDGAGLPAVDAVFVTVVSFLLGGIGTEFVMIASAVTVACFVVIILLIKRMS